MNKYLTLLNEHKLEEADEYRKAQIPDKLYKFISLSDDEPMNNLKLQTLLNKQIWISSVSSLNDPYEFQCMYIDKKRLKQCDYPDSIIRGMESFLRSFIEHFGVVSLSANSFDFLPMWAYYANNYKGFCIEYKTIKPDVIFPVFYEKNRIPLASIIANYFNEYRMLKSGKKPSPDIAFDETILRNQMFLKHESWKNEKEYRIIYPLEEGKGKTVCASDLGLQINSVCVGYDCSEENKKQLREICATLGCDLFETTIQQNSYTLLEMID